MDSLVSPMPSQGFTITYLNERIYVIGGKVTAVASIVPSKHLYVFSVPSADADETTVRLACERMPFEIWDHAQCIIPPCTVLPSGGIFVFGGRANSVSGFSELAYVLEPCPDQHHRVHTIRLSVKPGVAKTGLLRAGACVAQVPGQHCMLVVHGGLGVCRTVHQDWLLLRLMAPAAHGATRASFCASVALMACPHSSPGPGGRCLLHPLGAPQEVASSDLPTMLLSPVPRRVAAPSARGLGGFFRVATIDTERRVVSVCDAPLPDTLQRLARLHALYACPVLDASPSAVALAVLPRHVTDANQAFALWAAERSRGLAVSFREVSPALAGPAAVAQSVQLAYACHRPGSCQLVFVSVGSHSAGAPWSLWQVPAVRWQPGPATAGSPAPAVRSKVHTLGINAPRAACDVQGSYTGAYDIHAPLYEAGTVDAGLTGPTGPTSPSGARKRTRPEGTGAVDWHTPGRGSPTGAPLTGRSPKPGGGNGRAEARAREGGAVPQPLAADGGSRCLPRPGRVGADSRGRSLGQGDPGSGDVLETSRLRAQALDLHADAAGSRAAARAAQEAAEEARADLAHARAVAAGAQEECSEARRRCVGLEAQLLDLHGSIRALEKRLADEQERHKTATERCESQLAKAMSRAEEAEARTEQGQAACARLQRQLDAEQAAHSAVIVEIEKRHCTLLKEKEAAESSMRAAHDKLDAQAADLARLLQERSARAGELAAVQSRLAASEHALAAEQARRERDAAALEAGHTAREAELRRAVRVAQQDQQTVEALAAHRAEAARQKAANAVEELRTREKELSRANERVAEQGGARHAAEERANEADARARGLRVRLEETSRATEAAQLRAQELGARASEQGEQIQAKEGEIARLEAANGELQQHLRDAQAELVGLRSRVDQLGADKAEFVRLVDLVAATSATLSSGVTSLQAASTSAAQRLHRPA